MEEFRIKYQRTNRRIIIGLAALFVIIMVVKVFVPAGENAMHDKLFSFVEGFVAGLILVAIFYFASTIGALKDENKLRLLYNQAMDERQQLIRDKAGIPLLNIAVVILVVAGVVAGYFEALVSYTLLGVVIFLILYQIAAKLYFSRKY